MSGVFRPRRICNLNARQLNAISQFLPTLPRFMPLVYIPIEQFLLSQEIDVLKINNDRNFGSDHLPLITDLVI
jgi:hypothetical protein